MRDEEKSWRDVRLTWHDISDLFLMLLVLFFMYFLMPELTAKIARGMIGITCPPCPEVDTCYE